MRIGRWMFVLLVSLLIIVANCSSPPGPPLRIAVQSIWPSFGAAFIAQEKGLFAQYGVQVTLIPVPGNSGYMETLKLYKEGKADAAFIMFADALMLDAEGVATRVIYALDYSDTSDLIVGQATLNSLSDLKGKKVSFEGFNTFSHLFVLKLLERAGVREGEFQAANINPFEVLAALEADKIQAGHVYGTAATDTLTQGYKILGKAGDISHLMVEGLVAHAEVVHSRREEMQKVIKALIEAMGWLQHFPKEGLGLIAQHTGVSKIELENTFKGLHTLTLSENQEIFKKGGKLFKGGQEIIDFFYRKGVLIKIPDLNVVIDGQFIQPD